MTKVIAPGQPSGKEFSNASSMDFAGLFSRWMGGHQISPRDAHQLRHSGEPAGRPRMAMPEAAMNENHLVSAWKN
jgi:hypothetical protein